MKFKEILKKIGNFFYNYRKKRVIFIETNQSNDVIKELGKNLSKLVPENRIFIVPSTTATELKITKKWL